MAGKVLRRVVRAGRLTPQQTKRDAALRELIRAEFPPKKARSAPHSLSASLKQALKKSPKSSYQLARDAGLSQIMISRFISGERDIRLATADRLAQALGLKLVANSV